ncbi:MAG: OsmC family protein [Halobacteriota archaeon]
MAIDQSRQSKVEDGVNVADHQAFIDWVAANPDEAMIEFRASGVAEEVVNRTRATIGEWSLGGEEMVRERSHTLTFGLPPELEEAMAYLEPTDRYEAIEGALAGLTACINGTIAFNAIREGLHVDEISTRVRAPVDLRMLFGILDTDKADEMYGELTIDVDVSGTNLTDDGVEKIEGYYRRSPVYTLVALAHPNEPTVTVHSS